MGNRLSYKGYTAAIEFDEEDDLLFGKVEGIKSHILFDNTEGSGIADAFHKAVDEYLQDCASEGVEPERPFGGVFNVRVSPTLHRRYAEYAESHHTSMSRLVASALAAYQPVTGIAS